MSEDFMIGLLAGLLAATLLAVGFYELGEDSYEGSRVLQAPEPANSP